LKTILIYHLFHFFYFNFNWKKLWKRVKETQLNSYFKKEEIFYWGHSVDSNGSSFKRITKQISQNMKTLKRCKNFDTFIETLCLWKVVIGTNIGSSSCSCPCFRLYHICKLILASLLKLKLVQVPEEFSKKKIVSKNNQRGRSKKAEVLWLSRSEVTMREYLL